MSKQCKYCKEPLPSNDLDFCTEECLRKLLKQPENSKEETNPKATKAKNPQIEQILAYIGVTQDNTSKKIAYEHWYRVVEFGIRMNGKHDAILCKRGLPIH